MIGLGLWALHRALRRRLHEHTHEHDGSVHTHTHLHLGSITSHRQHTHAPYAVGILHGFGGGAQLFGVLPALAFPTMGQASTYFVGFVVASLLTMAGFAMAVGAISARGPQAFGRFFAATCGVASCAVGA